jgi:hypothetical protein
MRINHSGLIPTTDVPWIGQIQGKISLEVSR